MLIVDGQIHLWAKGTPSAHHRQEPYSMQQALAGMDEAGVDRAVIHPVMWDPDSNELAVEAVRPAPNSKGVGLSANGCRVEQYSKSLRWVLGPGPHQFGEGGK